MIIWGILGGEIIRPGPPGHANTRRAFGFDWGSVGSVVDLGGCRGFVLSNLVRFHPHLDACVYDLAASTPTPSSSPTWTLSTNEKAAQVEHWFRHRTDIEALNRDAKHGAALRHLPSGDPRVNTVWMWAALLAVAMSAWRQELCCLDHGNGRGRGTITRLRRELIRVPARIITHARSLHLRLPP